MFKHVAKTWNDHYEGTISYNGQRLAHIYIWRDKDGIIEIKVTDGDGMGMTDWLDHEELDY